MSERKREGDKLMQNISLPIRRRDHGDDKKTTGESARKFARITG